MTTDPQVLDGTITITGPATFRPMSATELMADPPLTVSDTAHVALLALVLLAMIAAVVIGGWLLAPESWLP